MKLSKLIHVTSVAPGLIGVAMSAWVVLFWPAANDLALGIQ